MWNSLSNINFYENLLAQKEKEKENISDDVNFAKLCRTCLREAADTNNLLRDFEMGAINITLDGRVLNMRDMLKEVTGLEVEESDLLPHQICNNCIQNVSGAYFFRVQSHKAENTLLKLVTAFSDDWEENYENVQLLEENSSDTKQSVSADEEENNEIMVEEVEFNSHVYKAEEDSDSAEIITDAVMNDDTIEEQELARSLEEVEIEYIEKTETDDEEVLNLAELVVELHKAKKRKRRNGLVKCPACPETFERNKDLDQHVKEVHPSAKAYKCSICHLRYSRLTALKRHLKTNHDQKTKLCSYCGKRFSRADDLKIHTRTHTNERPYVCTLCPKRYKQLSELKEHSLTHSRDKVFNCEVCGKSLSTRNGYYVHMRAHAGIKKHKCNYCGKAFVTSGELSSHIRHIHKKERPFVCTFENCDRKFATKLSLEIHTRSHTGERPFGCHICGKKLATNSSLSDHLRIHNGEKRFSCDICQRAFNKYAFLRKHIEKHEMIEAAKESRGSFICSTCGLSFLQLDQLNNHKKLHLDKTKLGIGSAKLDPNVKVVHREARAPSKGKDEHEFFIEYSDTESVELAMKDEDGDHKYSHS